MSAESKKNGVSAPLTVLESRSVREIPSFPSVFPPCPSVCVVDAEPALGTRADLSRPALSSRLGGRCCACSSQPAVFSSSSLTPSFLLLPANAFLTRVRMPGNRECAPAGGASQTTGGRPGSSSRGRRPLVLRSGGAQTALI